MIQGDNEFQRITKICNGEIRRPSQFADVPGPREAVVMTGLARNPEKRYPTARAMALALEAAIAPATSREIGEWVEAVADEALRERSAHVAEIERHSAEIVSGVDEQGDGPVSQVLGTEGRVSALPSYRPGRSSTAPIESWSNPSGGESLTPSGEEVEFRPKRRKAWALVAFLFLFAGGALAASGPGRRLGAAIWADPSIPSEASSIPAAKGSPSALPSTPTTVATNLSPPPAPAPASTATSASTHAEAAPEPVPRSHPHRGRSSPSGAPDAPAVEPAALVPVPAAPPARSAARPASAATAAPAPDCAVPYTMDAEGIRHPKLECL